MRPERDDIIGQDELIHAVLDVVAETWLDRAVTPSDREQLHEAVRQRLGQLSIETRSTAAKTISDRNVFTPPELAREWGVSPDKILGWIRSGELRAINIAATQGGRPRYRIDAEAIREFKQRRATQSPAPIVRRKRRMSPDVIEFF